MTAQSGYIGSTSTNLLGANYAQHVGVGIVDISGGIYGTDGDGDDDETDGNVSDVLGMGFQAYYVSTGVYTIVLNQRPVDIIAVTASVLRASGCVVPTITGISGASITIALYDPDSPSLTDLAAADQLKFSVKACYKLPASF
jgi:hypothetical protein